MRNTILCGDVREQLRLLDSDSVNCVVTSPPYWGLRDYGSEGQIGLEATPEQYVCNMVEVFREIRRVLRDDGTVWLNLGDSYASSGTSDGAGFSRLHEWTGGGAHRRGGRGQGDKGRAPTISGLKPKDLVGIPWRVAFALQADGWWLRSDIIWSKPNPMPESVTDRPTKAHEYIFLLAKGEWKTRVVDLSNLADERFHFGQHLGAQATGSWSTQMCVELATAIFNRAQRQHDFSLPPFYAEIWQQGTETSNGNGIGCLPYVHRAASIAAEFLNAKRTTKEFFNEINRIWLNLPEAHDLLIGGIPPVSLNPPSLYRDGDTAIAVNYSGQICKVDLASLHVSILTPSSGSYYYDHEAIREPMSEVSLARISQPNFANQTGGSKDYANGTNPNRSMRKTLENFKVRVDKQRGHGRRHAGFNDRWDAMSKEEQAAGGRNKRSVWEVTTHGYPEAHFATYPPELIKPCILAGCPENGVVLDPFFGSGTTGLVAAKAGRDWIGIELNPAYVEMAERRLMGVKARLL